MQQTPPILDREFNSVLSWKQQNFQKPSFLPTYFVAVLFAGKKNRFLRVGSASRTVKFKRENLVVNFQQK